MDKRRQSILKQDGRIPLQDTVIPDFPDEDTATVTVTKSRRVSFGANFVKEFLIGSAVSTQFYSEYEQAVSSSDSSNPNSSRSGILDRSTLVSEDDALNLCVKSTNHCDNEPLKKKFCFEKPNVYSEINDKNNENVWDFNVSNGSNIFVEKNLNYSSKPDLSRNNVRCTKNVNPLNESLTTDKQFQNKRNECELDSSKLNETLEKKSKVGKFSSTICFSADSPTADVEFTEGCITLAKIILDKKKKDMKVYIKGTPKESKKEDRDEGNTFVFESDDSDVGMRLTKCVDESESDIALSSGNFSNCFLNPKGGSAMEEFDESHENIENVPFHMYSLNMMLGSGNDSQGDDELEKSLFHPERSLTEMLKSGPLQTSLSDFSHEENDNMEECDMDISSPDMLKSTPVSKKLKTGGEEWSADTVENSPPRHSPPVGEEDEECTSPVFSKVTFQGDTSLLGKLELSMTDPLEMSLSDHMPSAGGKEESKLLLSNSSPLKSFELVECTTAPAIEEAIMEDKVIVSPSDDENHKDSYVNSPVAEDDQKEESLVKILDDFPPTEEDREMINSPTVKETVPFSPLKESVEDPLPDGKLPDEIVPEEENTECDGHKHVSEEVSQEADVSIAPKEEESIDLADVPGVEIQAGGPADLSVCGHSSDHEMDFSNVANRTADTNENNETDAGDATESVKESSFQEYEEMSPVFDDASKASKLNFPSFDEENSIKVPEADPEMEMSASGDRRSHRPEEKSIVETCQETFDVRSSGKSFLQETQLVESSVLTESTCVEGDQISLGDRKVLDLLKEQAEESNCAWTVDAINHVEHCWSFTFPILKSFAIMKFKLVPPKDRSLVSFSLVLDAGLELRESNEYQLEKDRIGIDFAFDKLKSNFRRESRELDNVRKIPIFLDKMNLIMGKVTGILNQLIRILKEYPGSKLKESVLSFRLYSFPLFFSYQIAIDVGDPFQLSEKSVSVQKHFGNLSVGLVKSLFNDSLGSEEFLVRFIRTLTESVIRMERESGSVTKRSHIRLIR